jgi:carbon-monoxide dehydrogenase medium subunit
MGAFPRHREPAACTLAVGAAAAVRHAASQIANATVRNMGTIGGSIANADPAACYPAAVLGLGATVHTDRRSIAADSFFTGMYETTLQPGELIVSVSFPIPQKAAYIKYKQPASRFALVGVFVSQGALGVRVAVTGAKSSAFRAGDIEAALGKSFTPGSAKAVKLPDTDMNSDLHGSAAYRAAMVSVMAARAVEKALAR